MPLAFPHDLQHTVARTCKDRAMGGCVAKSRALGFPAMSDDGSRMTIAIPASGLSDHMLRFDRRHERRAGRIARAMVSGHHDIHRAQTAVHQPVLLICANVAGQQNGVRCPANPQHAGVAIPLPGPCAQGYVAGPERPEEVEPYAVHLPSDAVAALTIGPRQPWHFASPEQPPFAYKPRG